MYHYSISCGPFASLLFNLKKIGAIPLHKTKTSSPHYQFLKIIINVEHEHDHQQKSVRIINDDRSKLNHNRLTCISLT